MTASQAASVLSFNIIPPTVRQQQQVRPYYAFADTLDVDRYELDGKVQRLEQALSENANDEG